MPNNDTSTEDQITPAARKPYEKPSFRYEKVFVTTALSCGKIASRPRLVRVTRRCHDSFSSTVGRC